MWLARDPHDRGSFISPVMTIVDGMAAAYVSLMASYFNTRVAQVTGTATDIWLDPDSYRADILRPDSPIFPSSAYGTYITKLEEGEPPSVADGMASTWLKRSIRTHAQMVQVRGAEDWTDNAGDTPVVGYRRVITGPTTCEYCRLASERLYFRGDLAPIHHGCDCGVGLVFEGEDHGLFTTRKKLVPIKQDTALGPVLDQEQPAKNTQ